MRMFITSKNKYLSNDMKIFGTCSIPLINVLYINKLLNKIDISCVTFDLNYLKTTLQPTTFSLFQILLPFIDTANLLASLHNALCA